MGDNQKFKSAFVGFNKKEVITYLDLISDEHQRELSELKEEIRQKDKTIFELDTRLSDKEEKYDLLQRETREKYQTYADSSSMIASLVYVAQLKAKEIARQAETDAERKREAARENYDSIVAEAENIRALAVSRADAYLSGKTSEADSYSTRVRSEADAYAEQVRQEADDYAGQTKTEADTYAGQTRQAADGYAGQTKAYADSYAGQTKADADSYAGQTRQEADDYAGQTRTEADIYAGQTRQAADGCIDEARMKAEEYARSIREEADNYARRVKNEADSYVDRVRSEGNQIMLGIRKDGEAVIAEAEENRNKILADAQLECSRLLDSARDEHDRIVEEAQDIADKKRAYVDAEIASRIGTARKQYADIRYEMEGIVELMNQIQKRFMSSYRDIHMLSAEMPEELGAYNPDEMTGYDAESKESAYRVADNAGPLPQKGANSN